MPVPPEEAHAQALPCGPQIPPLDFHSTKARVSVKQCYARALPMSADQVTYLQEILERRTDSPKGHRGNKSRSARFSKQGYSKAPSAMAGTLERLQVGIIRTQELAVCP